METTNDTSSQLKLFVTYLGGSAPRSNIELHDVVFAVGATIEGCYEQLLEGWFGSPDGLHIDSWAELSVVDGYSISISEIPSESQKKLFFVNMGAYAQGQLVELHSNELYVSDDKKEVIQRAKQGKLKGSHFVHRDYLYDVDECLEVNKVGRYFIHLSPTNEVQPFDPVNAYHLIPRTLVKEFKERGK